MISQKDLEKKIGHLEPLLFTVQPIDPVIHVFPTTGGYAVMLNDDSAKQMGLHVF